jgi:hypothetical protein
MLVACSGVSFDVPVRPLQRAKASFTYQNEVVLDQTWMMGNDGVNQWPGPHLALVNVSCEQKQAS